MQKYFCNSLKLLNPHYNCVTSIIFNLNVLIPTKMFNFYFQITSPFDTKSYKIWYRLILTPENNQQTAPLSPNKRHHKNSFCNHKVPFNYFTKKFLLYLPCEEWHVISFYFSWWMISHYTVVDLQPRSVEWYFLQWNNLYYYSSGRRSKNKMSVPLNKYCGTTWI